MQLVGTPEVVIVAERHPLCRRFRDPTISRRADTPGDRLAHDCEAGVREGGRGAGDIHGRGVIDDDHLHVDVTLTEHAPQREGQKVGTVPGWDDDGHRFHAIATSTCAAAVLGWGRAVVPEHLSACCAQAGGAGPRTARIADRQKGQTGPDLFARRSRRDVRPARKPVISCLIGTLRASQRRTLARTRRPRAVSTACG